MKEIVRNTREALLNILNQGGKIRLNIRTRIFFDLLIVVTISGILSMIIGVYIINTHIIREAYVTLNEKLNMVINTYDWEIREKHHLLSYMAHRQTLRDAIIRKDISTLSRKMTELRDYYNFDIVNLTDSSGRLIAVSNSGNSAGSSVADISFIKKMLKTGKGGYGTEVVEPEYMMREGEDIAGKVRVEGYTKDGSIRIENRALVQWAGYPIVQDDILIGTLYGCVILNNNDEFVDRLKHIVFTDEKVNDYDVGSTTIFLDEMRVATNIMTSGNKRAVGTLVSMEVSEKVLMSGERWLDSAYVVDRWYLSGYYPLKNSEGGIIGIIYTGILQEKFRKIQQTIAFWFIAVIAVTFVISFIIAVFLSRSIASPIRRLTEFSNNILRGEYKKIDILSTDPLDMKRLCEAFNRMMDGILERDRKLSESIERRMLHSEKLASIGRLASGIAHEINNPLTGILTFSELLLEDLKGTKAEKDLYVIRNEAMRCREIVRGIFEFSRETQLQKTKASLNQVIWDLFLIFEKHVSFQNINIKKNLDFSIPDFEMDVIQIKSVISNLAVNAADAMAGGGDLIISTGYKPETGVVFMEITDTGCGISPENLKKIFDPFYTTKEPGKGTGLGLAVTFGIIRRHEGDIDIRSEVGKGTTAHIEFPVKSAGKI